jgi:hypothetical protein
MAEIERDSSVQHMGPTRDLDRHMAREQLIVFHVVDQNADRRHGPTGYDRSAVNRTGWNQSRPGSCIA